jgi:phosphonate transport system substrate-binding protein
MERHIVRKKLKRIFSLLLILSAFGCIVYYLSILAAYNQIEDRYRPRRWVTLDQNAPALPGDAQPEARDNSLLRIAIAPVISPAKSLAMYSVFADYLGAALNKKTSLIQRNSYAEVNDLIRHNGCDMAFVGTYSFVLGERDYGLQLLAAPQINGKNTYQCYIITHAGSPYKDLFALRGKRFASSDILSTAGWLYPAVRLLRSGENPNTFFSENVLTGSQDSSLMAVATKYVDGAAVRSLVYDRMVSEDPSLAGKITIIERSPEYGMPPLVVHPRIDPGLKSQLSEVLLHMHETAGGKMALATLGFDCFVPPEPALYDPVREAAAALDSHR